MVHYASHSDEYIHVYILLLCNHNNGNIFTVAKLTYVASAWFLDVSFSEIACYNKL